MRRSRILSSLLAAAIGMLLLASALAGRAQAADGAAAIAAAHKRIDDEIRGAQMSPFTAVDAHYIETGRTVKIGADARGTALDPPSAMPAMAAITYADGAFSIAPVDGAARPEIRVADESGSVAAGPGTSVTDKRAIGEKEIAAVGRFLLEMSPQSGMGRILVYDPDSAMKKTFDGLKWFDPDPALQVAATFKKLETPEKVTIGTSRGLKKIYYRAGSFAFKLEGKAQTLVALTESETPKAGDDLFIPFRDATTGHETYDVGRYVHVAYKGADAPYVIDFNKASNPNCNYSKLYNCPIPPTENLLAVPVRAGEMTYPAHH
jgi:uncharacterized protein